MCVARPLTVPADVCTLFRFWSQRTRIRFLLPRPVPSPPPTTGFDRVHPDTRRSGRRAGACLSVSQGAESILVLARRQRGRCCGGARMPVSHPCVRRVCLHAWLCSRCHLYPISHQSHQFHGPCRLFTDIFAALAQRAGCLQPDRPAEDHRRGVCWSTGVPASSAGALMQLSGDKSVVKGGSGRGRRGLLAD